MSAILFGSISTLADTSELQRDAFNRAFEKHGLDWHWDRDTYLGMLESSGGADRIATQAERTGEDVDAAAVHATKSELFRQSLPGAGIGPRPGVLETIRAAKTDGVRLALVTTTSRDNVDALLTALAPDLDRDDFALVVDTSVVDTPKPDPAAYRYALDALGESPDACVAVEDNLGGVAAAVGAALRVVAFPNANTAGHDFAAATERVDRLDHGALLRT
ncbi:HAD-IA family hydrolase [Pseudonocardia nematodicida]|uniref:HAD-IA family hydrolase n=1 Tax=Pseudonocardia nematodicida TaxID=1206997 RepID=A0ABV1KIW9_9PSEU